MPREIKLGTFLLGIEGVALSRHLVDADDEWVQARLAEVRDIAAGLDGDLYGASLPVPEHGVTSGYALWSETYDRPGNLLIDVEQPVVWSILDALPAGIALDAASGTGRHAHHLRELGHHVFAVDLTQEMLVRADADQRVRADFRALPLRNDRVDVAVCSLALTHLSDPTAAIAELVRVVRPGGTIVLSDMHPTAAVVTGQAFFQGADGAFAFVRNHLHLHSTYLAAFAAAGLVVVACLEPTPDREPTGLAARFIPDANHAALQGLPFALVWHLRKPS